MWPELHYNETLKKDQPKHFGPLDKKNGVLTASLKEDFIRPLVLALPIREVQYTLDPDCCDKKILCVLFQEQEYGDHLSAGCSSCTFDNKKENLAIRYRECLDVVRPVSLLRPYLAWAYYIIRTDRRKLGEVLTIADVTDKLGQWRSPLSGFELDIVHRAGIKPQAANMRSLLKIKNEHKSTLDYEVTILTIPQNIFECAREMEKEQFRVPCIT